MARDAGAPGAGVGPPGRSRLIAWYLPQYHPVPENDAWWGPGFTDWTNVAKARPRFPGHHQPHLPTELGFYDLRLPEVRRAQAELARAHGLHGFCYYHYWFNGRRLLARPFAEVLASGEPDFPFCLCWANENWTRAWDGLEQDVLIQQHYGEEDDRRHLRWLAEAFRDPRYIRIGGRPLFLVYRVSALPDPRRTAEVWREEAHALGIGDLYLCTVESLRFDRVDPTTIGFDAAVEFQPDWLSLGTPDRLLPNGTRMYDYASVVERMLARPEPAYPRFGCVTPGWDNTARRTKDAVIIHGATPRAYQRWLARVVERAAGRGEEAVVFINAWNEWAEAAYLEPCTRWGRAFLEATRDADREPSVAEPASVADGGAAPRSDDVAVSVCIPAYNGGRYLGEAIASVLAQSCTRFELIVVDDCSTDDTRAVVASFDDPRLSYVANPARLGLVENWNRCLELSRAPYVCVFHQDDVMLPENLAEKIAMLDRHPSVGMVHSNVYQIAADGAVLSAYWYFQPEPGDEGIHAGQDFFTMLFRGVNRVCCPSVVMRRSCYEQVGGFDPRLPFTADWEMWMRIALHADVAYLAKPLVKYRRHEEAETAKFLGAKGLEHALLAKQLILEKCPGQIAHADSLRGELAASHRELAMAEAARLYGQRLPSEAREYVALALSVGAMLHGDGAGENEEREWLTDVIDRAFNASHRDAVGDVPPETLRGSPIYASTLQAAFPRDLASHVSFRRIVKTIVMKLLRQPGFRWLGGLRTTGNRLFHC